MTAKQSASRGAKGEQATKIHNFAVKALDIAANPTIFGSMTKSRLPE
ncbi:hypothetical protein SAMN05428964_104214 [Thalassospira xiamenensis]|uniref:Uncharacterized protein n=1 Tax=Thalassospira xiamenensis TaxID=220697 RepID=A0A285TML9_9PROT|nr:hypothetical protein SAMN05428964_104214 [Thalassospira xiamenensis]